MWCQGREKSEVENNDLEIASRGFSRFWISNMPSRKMANAFGALKIVFGSGGENSEIKKTGKSLLGGF